jgi:hypothetical protein
VGPAITGVGVDQFQPSGTNSRRRWWPAAIEVRRSDEVGDGPREGMGGRENFKRSDTVSGADGSGPSEDGGDEAFNEVLSVAA